MKKLASSALLLLSLLAWSPGARAQTLLEEFEAGVPQGWVRSADVVTRPTGDESLGSAVTLTGAGSFVEIATADPSTLSFWRAPPRPGDDYVLRLEARCGADLVRREYAYGAEGASAGGSFVPEIIAVRHTGPCAIRWSLPVHRAGAASIDRVSIEALTPAERERLALEERIREMVTSQVTASTVGAATAQLDQLVDGVRQTAPGLANLSSRVHSVSAINETGAALAKASQLGNPLSYDYFGALVARVESFSPLPMRTHIGSMAANLRGSYQNVGALRGRGVFSALSSLALSAALGDFRSTFQSVIAVASLGREALARAADALEIRGRNREQRTEAVLDTIYRESNTFLGRMLDQTQRMQSRAARADSLAEETNRLAASADSTVARMIRLAGLPDRELGVFREAAMKRADNRPLEPEESAVLARFESGLREARQRAIAGGSGGITLLAEQIRAALAGSEQVYARYDPAVARQKQFYDEEISYYCNLRQLGSFSMANAETQRQWLENARAAAQAFINARRAFYQAYTPAQPAPSVTACPVLAL